MEVVIATGAAITPGARLVVLLEDGVGRRCVYTLNDVAVPPGELQLERPEDVPALLEGRDGRFIYFEHTGLIVAVDDALLPLYRQIVRD